MRVRSESIDGKTRILDAETGEPVRGVTAATVEIKAREVVADLRIWLPSLDVACTASVSGLHPLTGESKVLRRIEFADGNVVEF